MGGNLESIWNEVCKINDKLDELPGLIEISGNQVNVYTLDELGDNLGLIKAGEFRAGNNRIPGDSFSGIRIRYPTMSYPDTSTASSDRYNLVGVDADTMQVGIRSSDGVLVAGAGAVELDSRGIRLRNAESTATIAGQLLFETQDGTISTDGLYINSVGNWLAHVNRKSGADTDNMGGYIWYLQTLGGLIPNMMLRSVGDDTTRNDCQLVVPAPAGGYGQITMGGINLVAGDASSDIGENVFNNEGNDVDFRVESVGNANMLFVDAGNNRVGIGTATPTVALDVRGDIQGSGITGWNLAGETWTYASATTFTVPTDLTAKYHKGTKIKLTQTTAKYFYVIASSYSAPNTTVTVTGGSDYSLANAAITSPFFSYVENPRGFPHWFAYAPTLTGFSADPANAVYRFAMRGTTVMVTITQFTAGTSNATTFTMSLPITAKTITNDYWSGVSPLGINNSAAISNPMWIIASAGTAASFYLTAGAAWTASGTKCFGRYGCLLCYEA